LLKTYYSFVIILTVIDIIKDKKKKEIGPVNLVQLIETLHYVSRELMLELRSFHLFILKVEFLATINITKVF
jgi:hypothetical protein